MKPLLSATLRISVCRHGAPGPSPVVVAANHASHLDTPLILQALPGGPRRTAVGAAADYFYASRLRSAGVRLLFNTFPVRRPARPTGPRAAHGGRADADRLLTAGWNLLLFPEGTRSRDGVLGDFRRGAAALCLRHGVPCLPVGVTGTHHAMPRGRRWPRPGRPPVVVHLGAPLTPAPAEDAQAFTGRVAAAVRALIACPLGEQP
ncbi:lysophospholipid acyltransferase family protein [Actinoplanes palleronii]|uniref:lysophospholipid acyltransferase family protein n=1 Tax=Actinoplanes palleronii TaxID=113570 RepID=UPI0019408CD0|nr:lysophospholipid acyltransferase family protein [Actinoplanes palleronii]